MATLSSAPVKYSEPTPATPPPTSVAPSPAPVPQQQTQPAMLPAPNYGGITQGFNSGQLTPEAQAADPMTRGTMKWGGMDFDPTKSANLHTATPLQPGQPPAPIFGESTEDYQKRVIAHFAAQGQQVSFGQGGVIRNDSYQGGTQPLPAGAQTAMPIRAQGEDDAAYQLRMAQYYQSRGMTQEAQAAQQKAQQSQQASTAMSGLQPAQNWNDLWGDWKGTYGGMVDAAGGGYGGLNTVNTALGGGTANTTGMQTPMAVQQYQDQVLKASRDAQAGLTPAQLAQVQASGAAPGSPEWHQRILAVAGVQMPTMEQTMQGMLPQGAMPASNVNMLQPQNAISTAGPPADRSPFGDIISSMGPGSDPRAPSGATLFNNPNAPVTDPNALDRNITPDNSLIGQRIGYDINPQMVEGGNLMDLAMRTFQDQQGLMDARLTNTVKGLRDRTAAMGRTGSGLFDREFTDINREDRATREAMLSNMALQAGGSDLERALRANLANQNVDLQAQGGRLEHLRGERAYERGLSRDASADELARLGMLQGAGGYDSSGTNIQAAQLMNALAAMFGGSAGELGGQAGNAMQQILQILMGGGGNQPAQGGGVSQPGHTLPPIPEPNIPRQPDQIVPDSPWG